MRPSDFHGSGSPRRESGWTEIHPAFNGPFSRCSCTSMQSVSRPQKLTEFHFGGIPRSHSSPALTYPHRRLRRVRALGALRPVAKGIHQRPCKRRLSSRDPECPGGRNSRQPGPTSDSLGDFVVAGLAPGSYTVTVTSVGFKTLAQTVTVAAGQTVPLNAVLQVASGAEQVVVSASSGQNMLQADQ